MYQQKLDGRWHEVMLGSHLVVGELVGPTFWPFDIVLYDARDVRQMPLGERLAMLDSLTWPETWRRVPSGSGGEFLEAVLASGGEGVVAKHVQSRFGQNWIKCKRVETHDCIVAEIHPEKMSVRLSQLDGGRTLDCGWVPVLSDRVLAGLTVGAVVEVACHSRHASGKFREPRFVRVRTDKAALDCAV